MPNSPQPRHSPRRPIDAVYQWIDQRCGASPADDFMFAVRCRAVVITSLVFAVVTLALMVAVTCITVELTPGKMTGWSAIALYLLAPVVLFRTKSPTAGAVFLFCIIYLAVVYVSYRNGGVTAHVTPFLVVLPLAAGMLFSAKAFVISTVAVFAGLGFLFYLSEVDLALAPPYTAHQMQHARLVVLAISVLCAALTMGGYMAITRDIQRRLENARDAADRANAAKSVFLANMSHEIRTPMTGVIGALDLLTDRRLDHEDRDLVRNARSSARVLLTVINDILDYSKLEAGKVAIDEREFSLSRLVRELVGGFEGKAIGKGIALRTSVGPTVPDWVVSDEVRLRQILTNLIGNAIKFTHAGYVQLSVTADKAAPRRHTVRFEVIDTGVGIALEDQDRLFQRFEQADGTTTRQFGGTGLGLAIVKELVGLLDGRLAVMSEAGCGATFCFEVEVAEGTAASYGPEQAAGADDPADAGLDLLLAEDNAINRALIGAMLNGLGHRVAIVNNGQEAIEALGQKPFDAALLDVHMPIMDGPTAARNIRAAGQAWSTIPIVAITADVFADRLSEFRNAGMTHYVAKPIDIAQLADVLERVRRARADHMAA